MRARLSGPLGSLFFSVAGIAALAPVALAATITVNSTADTAANDGLCTLREAITAANNDAASGAAAGECAAGSGADTIAFNVTGTGCDGSGVCTIAPATNLPNVGASVTFDGYTQPGASVNTLSAGTNAVLKIVLSGAGLTGICLYLPGSHVTIRGLVINGCSQAIYGVGSDQKVLGSFIGVNAAGTAAVANGVGLTFNGASSVTIGGTDPADRNLISGNSSGSGSALQAAGASGFVIQGNLVGTNAAGTAAIPNVYNGAALTINGASNTLIGGTAAGAGNVVSGNTGGGIATGGNGVTVQGNLVGTTASGTGSLGNSSYGISLSGAATLGGTGAGEGNIIAHNQLGGVWINAGTTGAKVRGNSIHDNGAGGYIGIDNLPLGVTLNDAGDVTSPQNFPEITGVTASSVSGTLNSKAGSMFDIDVYASPACSPSGYGEGQTYLGSTLATTNASGNASFTANMTVPAGQKVTATATSQDASGTTSEFSQCEGLRAAFLDADPTAGATSDGNGIFEPGETATIRPNWTNPTQVTLALTSTASSLTGPGGASYSIVDGADDYGSILSGHTQNCSATGNCLSMFVSDPASRPSTHWDAQFTETLSSGHGTHGWKLHLGDSFSDVPRSETFYKKIETVFHNGITFGCTATQYCPNDFVPRSQMAIFLTRGIIAGGGIPTSGMVGGQAYNCVAGGTSLFTDVAPTDIFCKHVHYIAAQNVTLGCGSGKFCPNGNVSRVEMAAFIAKAIKAPAGGSAIPVTYGPDPVTGMSYSCNPSSPSGLFFDVPATDVFCKHVHYLRATGVIAGCGVTSYCPTQSVKRDEMAKFLSNAFGLLLYGP